MCIPTLFFAQGSSLRNEILLHPGDGFTAYTYDKGAFSYQQAITPYPSWAWWGLTDWLTIELDFEAWLGGVPSFNARIKVADQVGKKPALAYETMLQYLKTEFDQFENLDHLAINRKGLSWYHRMNASWKLNDGWHIHISTGFTYAEQLGMEDLRVNQEAITSHRQLISPDVSVALDWRKSEWLALFTAASYGSTFLYADNIPRKLQFSVARWSRFSN